MADWEVLDWTCPRCAASRMKTCTTKDGRPRPTHLVRRLISILLQLAIRRGLGQPSAERAQIVRSLAMAQEPDTSAREGYLWHQATDELYQWEQVVAAAGLHAAPPSRATSTATGSATQPSRPPAASPRPGDYCVNGTASAQSIRSTKSSWSMCCVPRRACSPVRGAAAIFSGLKPTSCVGPGISTLPGGTWAGTWHSDVP